MAKKLPRARVKVKCDLRSYDGDRTSLKRELKPAAGGSLEEEAGLPFTLVLTAGPDLQGVDPRATLDEMLATHAAAFIWRNYGKRFKRVAEVLDFASK